MRVLLVDPAAFTPSYDQALAAALGAAGAEVELATAPRWHGPAAAAAGHARRPAFSRLLARGPAARLARFGAARRAVRAASYPLDLLRLAAAAQRTPPDVVHWQWSLAPAFERGILGWLARRGAAVVVTVHNPRPRAGDRGATARAIGLAPRADRLITLSHWARAELVACGVDAARVDVVPHGLAPPEAGGRGAARRRLGLPETAPVALVAGLLRAYKGTEIALRAFAEVARELPQARLAIVGLPAAGAPPVARRVRELGLDAAVRLELRYLPDAELALWIAACDVAVLPYLEASQSGIGSLAIANERAVVASRVGGLSEMVGEEESGLLVAPGEPAQLARALADLLRDRARADAVGRRLRQRAIAAGAGWSDVARATLAVYERALAAGRERRR